MKKVFILKNFKNKDIFVSPITPKYFNTRESAEYTRIFMQIPEYQIVATFLPPEESVENLQTFNYKANKGKLGYSND